MFQRVGSGNERLSLAYGLIACLAWGVLAPSSAMAACGTDVTSRTTAGSTERLMIALARTDGRVPSVRAIPVLPLLGALLLGQTRPTTAAAAGRRFGPACRELGVLDDRRRNPLTRRGLVRLRTGQVPAYPSNLPDSAPAPPGTLTAILSDP